MEKLNQKIKLFLLSSLLACALLALVPFAKADITIFSGIAVSIGPSRYLTMGKTFTFVSPVTYGNGFMDGRGFWINSTRSLTLDCWFEYSWVNYTIAGSGTQRIYNGTRPDTVYVNGVVGSYGVDWTYSSGITTIFTATTKAAVSWGIVIPPVDNPPALSSYSISSYTEYLPCTFTAYWTDDHGMSLGWMATNITGFFMNGTVQDISATWMFTQVETLPIQNTTITFIFYATDTVGHEVASATYSMIVRAAPILGTDNEVAPSGVIVYGRDVTFYFPSGSSFGFQGLGEINMTVSAGTFDCPSSNITVYMEEGAIYFTSTYTFALTVKASVPPDGRTINVYASGTDLNITQVSTREWTITAYSSRNPSIISWNYSGISYIDMYTMLAIGLIGIFLMVFVPCWIAWHVKDHGLDEETWNRIFLGMVFFFIGLGLVLVWIWP